MLTKHFFAPQKYYFPSKKQNFQASSIQKLPRFSVITPNLQEKRAVIVGVLSYHSSPPRSIPTMKSGASLKGAREPA